MNSKLKNIILRRQRRGEGIPMGSMRLEYIYFHTLVVIISWANIPNMDPMGYTNQFFLTKTLRYLDAKKQYLPTELTAGRKKMMGHRIFLSERPGPLVTMLVEKP